MSPRTTTTSQAAIGDSLEIRLKHGDQAIIDESWPINTESAQDLAAELVAAVERWRANLGQSQPAGVN